MGKRLTLLGGRTAARKARKRTSEVEVGRWTGKERPSQSRAGGGEGRAEGPAGGAWGQQGRGWRQGTWGLCPAPASRMSHSAQRLAGTSPRQMEPQETLLLTPLQHQFSKAGASVTPQDSPMRLPLPPRLPGLAFTPHSLPGL